MDHKTAILVFANSPEQELQHKPMVKGISFFEMLTQQTLKVVGETGLPYFHYTESQQYGFSFGERFVNALQAVFGKGYENVIAIGNDTPHLRTRELLNASEALESDNFVMGPSADGGFYLMGLHRSNFKASEFLRLPWQSDDLAEALCTLAMDQGKIVVSFKTLFDLDTTGDLRLFRSRFPNAWKRLLALIAEILRQKILRPPAVADTYLLQVCAKFFNKGSPSAPRAAIA